MNMTSKHQFSQILRGHLQFENFCLPQRFQDSVLQYEASCLDLGTVCNLAIYPIDRN